MELLNLAGIQKESKYLEQFFRISEAELSENVHLEIYNRLWRYRITLSTALFLGGLGGGQYYNRKNLFELQKRILIN